MCSVQGGELMEEWLDEILERVARMEMGLCMCKRMLVEWCR